MNLFIGIQSGKGDSIVINGNVPLKISDLHDPSEDPPFENYNGFEFKGNSYTIESILTSNNNAFI